MTDAPEAQNIQEAVNNFEANPTNVDLTKLDVNFKTTADLYDSNSHPVEYYQDALKTSTDEILDINAYAKGTRYQMNKVRKDWIKYVRHCSHRTEPS